MNREDIIRLVRQAANEEMEIAVLSISELEKYTALVEAAEREACAEIAEKQRYAMNISLTSHPVQNGTAVGIANAIRARGQA